MKLQKLFVTAALASSMWAIASAAQAAPVHLVENRQPRFVIVTRPNPEPQVTEAVNELNYWVQRITGVSLPVQTTTQWDGQSPYIAVGASELTGRNGWDKTPLAQEEARVIIEPQRIGLLGNDKAPYPGVTWSGSYYAVLELVQKELGARWLWPGELGEVFTPRQTLTVDTKSWNWKPQLTMIRELRNGYGGTGVANTLAENLGVKIDAQDWNKISREHVTWLKRERMNRSTNARFGHAFTDWWDKYSKDHPDWFARPPQGVKQISPKGVQLNVSNPEVHQKIIDNWKAQWEKDPAANQYLSAAPNDSMGYDTRPETRAWDAPQLADKSDEEIFRTTRDFPFLSDRHVRMWNILAKKMAAIDPNAKVTGYAYMGYRHPPLTSIKLEDNIVIGYVGGEGFYPDERFIVDEWNGWAAANARLTWRPNLLHTGHGTGYNFSRTLFNDFDFFLKRNLLGTDFDSLVGNWSGQGLSYYVLAEKHSRPNATYEELTGEYFSAFGKAAPAMQEYYAYFEKVTADAPELLRQHKLVSRMTWGGWWPAHARLVPLMLTPEVVAQADSLLQKAEAAADTPLQRQRVEMIRRGFDHSKLMAQTFRQLNLQDPNAKLPANKKEILQPLWEHRQKMLTDVSVPVARLFLHEQRIFNLWDDFIQKP